MLENGTIVLCMLKSQEELQQALLHPVTEKDRTLYAAAYAGYAEALIAHGLPCIFIEEKETGESIEPVYGADMIILETDDWNWKEDEEFLLRIWQRHYHLPWTIAETERLLIRESVAEDLIPISRFYEEERDNPDVKPFSEEPEAEFRAYIAHRYPVFGYGLWTVTEKKSGRVIGRMGFETFTETADGESVPELSVLLGRDYRGCGYAREAAQALLVYAKEELGFSQVSYRTSKENAASAALAEKLGF